MTEPRIVYLREGEAAVQNHTRNYLSGLFAGVLLTILALYVVRVLISPGGGDGGPESVDEPAEDGADRPLEAVGGGGGGCVD